MGPTLALWAALCFALWEKRVCFFFADVYRGDHVTAVQMRGCNLVGHTSVDNVFLVANVGHLKCKLLKFKD